MGITLDTIAEIRSGSAMKPGAGDAAFVQIGNVTAADFKPEALARGSYPARSATEAALRPGDVLLAIKGRENGTALFPKPAEEVFATLDVAVIRCDRNRILPEYLATWLGMPSTQAGLKRLQAGSGVPRVSLDSLQSLTIPLPALERQRCIAELAQAFRTESEQLVRLSELKSQLHAELLRRVVEEEPVPGSNPARDRKRPGGHATTSRAMSNRHYERKSEYGEEQ